MPAGPDERGRIYDDVLVDHESGLHRAGESRLEDADLFAAEQLARDGETQLRQRLKTRAEVLRMVCGLARDEQRHPVRVHVHAIGGHRIEQRERTPAEPGEHDPSREVVALVAAPGEPHEPRDHVQELPRLDVQRRARIDERTHAVAK